MEARRLLHELRRRYSLSQTPEGPLRTCLAHPFPRGETPFDAVEYLALDLETTGLKAGEHAILSMGFVPVRGDRIVLKDAGHLLIQPERPIPETAAVIHGLTDDMTTAQGVPLAEAMALLLGAMTGRILLVHYASLERAFLRHACRTVYGVAPPLPMVDTLALELAVHPGKESVKAREMGLGRLRERYGLPRHRAHHALSDAVATAELFLAQMSRRWARTPPGEIIPLHGILTW